MLISTEEGAQENFLSELSPGDRQRNERGWGKWERERCAKGCWKLAKNFQKHLQYMGVALLLGQGSWSMRLTTPFSSYSNGSSVNSGDGIKAQKCSLSKCNLLLTGIVLCLKNIFQLSSKYIRVSMSSFKLYVS